MMQDKNLYEYATIRFVPRVEREEFVNIGVVVFCKKAKFLSGLYHIDHAKILALCAESDIEQLKENITAFAKILDGDKCAGPIAQLDAPSRFRWLTAIRSSAIQTSRPHPGLSSDLHSTTNRLFQELVL